MRILIKHRDVSGVYLCHEGPHWFWGPLEQATFYSIETAASLVKSFPLWNELLEVDQEDALIEIDFTPETVPPPRRRIPSAIL